MMKKFLLSMVAVATIAGAMAQGSQVDFSNPAYAKWGATVEEREQNMFAATFMREALEAKNYDEAAKQLQIILENCPEASDAVFSRAVLLYRAKIARAADMAEKRVMIDSLMLIHDLRVKYFMDHPTHGKKYTLDNKARDYYNYSKSNRAGLRDVFKEAIDANGEAADPALVLLYFQNICEDYKMDEVMADEVINEYDRLAPFFENLEGEDVKLAEAYNASFVTSGVANCENLEAIYSKKLEATPDDEKVLAQAVRLMDREGCKTPFYASIAEKYYEISPSAQSAMALAAIFQNDGDYDKAVKYLSDALAAETDMEAQEALNARIALIELAASRMGSALTYARTSLNTDDGTESDNGIALFVIAQCYGASAASCEGFSGQIGYLAAYDTMQRALNNFTPEEESYKAHAKSMMSQYKAFFPTSEECFFNEIAKGSTYKVDCGVATGVSTIIRTRD